MLLDDGWGTGKGGLDLALFYVKPSKLVTKGAGKYKTKYSFCVKECIASDSKRTF